MTLYIPFVPCILLTNNYIKYTYVIYMYICILKSAKINTLGAGFS